MNEQMNFYMYYENLVNPVCNKVMLVFYLTQSTLCMYMLQSLCSQKKVDKKLYGVISNWNQGRQHIIISIDLYLSLFLCCLHT